MAVKALPFCVAAPLLTAPSTAQHLFDLLLEALPAKDEVAVRSTTDLLHCSQIKSGAKQQPIGVALSNITMPQRKVRRMCTE